MKCPNCEKRTQVNLDTHSEGFTSEESPVKECGDCGMVWRIINVGGENRIDIIKKPTK